MGFYFQKALISLILSIFLISLATAQTIPQFTSESNWVVTSQSSLEKAYEINITDTNICLTPISNPYYFDKVIVEKSWYEKVVDTLKDVLIKDIPLEECSLKEEECIKQDLIKSDVKEVSNYSYPIPTKIKVETDKDSKTIDLKDNQFCYFPTGEEKWIKLGDNSIYIFNITTQNNSNYLQNVSYKTNFTYTSLTGDSNPLRGFNLIRRADALPYIQDDDNSYAYFDGVNDYVNLGDPASLESTTGEITLSAWIKTNVVSDYREIVRKDQTGRTIFSLQASNVLSFGSYNGTAYNELDCAFFDSSYIGKWTYVTATHNATGEKKVYINGQERCNNSVGGAYFTIGAGWWVIGSNNGASEFWNGSIDNFMMLNRSLNNTEIASLYSLGRKDTTYTDDSLLGAWRFDNSNVSVAKDTIGLNNGTFNNGASYGYDNSGLVAYYPFDMDDNVTAWDFTGNNLDGTYNGAKTGTGLYGRGASFDGLDQRINITSPSINGEFTFSTWVKPSTPDNTWHTLLGVWNSYVSNVWIGLYNQQKIYVYMQGTTCSGASYFASYTNEVWNYVTVTFNGSYVQTYVNGVVTSGGACSNNITQTTQLLSLGDSATYDLNGTLDEVMIFNRALNSSQISNIYNNQSQRFKSPSQQIIAQQKTTEVFEDRIQINTSYQSYAGSYTNISVGAWDKSKGYNSSLIDGLVAYYPFDDNANDYLGRFNGTIENTILNNTGGKYAGAYEFNGINTSIKSDVDLSNQDFSASLWVNLKGNSAYSTSTTAEFISQGRNIMFGTQQGFSLGRYGSTLYYQVANLTNTSGISTPFAQYSVGTGYHHYVITYNVTNGNSTLWVDNVLKGSAQMYLGDVWRTGYKLDVGGFVASYGIYHNGSVDDVMIFNKSLSSTEVKELYVNGLANWNYTEEQVNNGHNLFEVENTTTNYIIPIRYITSPNNFYSPILFGDIKVNGYPMAYPPILNIIYPQSKFYNAVQTNLNYTIVDLNNDAESCWYTTNEGVTNNSIVVVGTNWTTLSSSEGSNTWRVYCNDSENLQGTSSVTFTQDTIFPDVNILYPIDTYNYNYNITNENYSVSDTNLDSCWWSDDYGATNNSVNCGTNLTEEYSDGSYNFRVYANDSAGNVMSDIINFVVDTVNPIINIVNPIGLFSGTSFPLSVTYETGMNSFWYSISTDLSTNYSFGPNVTIKNFYHTGNHIMYVWVNDSAGNVGSDSQAFQFTYVPAGNITTCPINKFGYNNPYLPQLKNPECESI